MITDLFYGWLQGHPLNTYISNVWGLYGEGVVLTAKVALVSLTAVYAFLWLYLCSLSDDELLEMGVSL